MTAEPSTPDPNAQEPSETPESWRWNAGVISLSRRRAGIGLDSGARFLKQVHGHTTHIPTSRNPLSQFTKAASTKPPRSTTLS